MRESALPEGAISLLYFQFYPFLTPLTLPPDSSLSCAPLPSPLRSTEGLPGGLRATPGRTAATPKMAARRCRPAPAAPCPPWAGRRRRRCLLPAASCRRVMRASALTPCHVSPGSCGAEPSRAGPGQTEPNRAEEGRAEPCRAVPGVPAAGRGEARWRAPRVRREGRCRRPTCRRGRRAGGRGTTSGAAWRRRGRTRRGARSCGWPSRHAAPSSG